MEVIGDHVEYSGFVDEDPFHPGPIFRCRTCRKLVHEDHIQIHVYRWCVAAALNWRISGLIDKLPKSI